MPEIIQPAVKGVPTKGGRFVVQVDTAYTGGINTPSWLAVFGSKKNTPKKSDAMQNTRDLDSGDWDSSAPFTKGWTLSASLGRKKYAGAYDAGQEFIREANWASKLLHVRWFDRNGGVEAYEGYGYATWEEGDADNSAEDIVAVTITGDGELIRITNPHTQTTAPVVESADPTGRAAGQTVTIRGSKFTGATGVKFDTVSVAANAYNIVSDRTIVAVVPAGSAGSAPITVINAVGTSNALPYTRA